MLGRAYSDKDGKTADTVFLKGGDLGSFHWCRAILRAGKRHQVRCHSADIIAPLVGDILYGSSYKSQSERVGLIADRINFKWKGQRYRFQLHHAKDIMRDWLDEEWGN